MAVMATPLFFLIDLKWRRVESRSTVRYSSEREVPNRLELPRSMAYLHSVLCGSNRRLCLAGEYVVVSSLSCYVVIDNPSHGAAAEAAAPQKGDQQTLVGSLASTTERSVGV